MKATTATLVSTIAVLTSGVAAFAVNTRVLESAAPKPSPGFPLVTTEAAASTPTSPPVASSRAPRSVAADTEAAGATGERGTVTTYALGSIGTIALTRGADGVTVQSIDSSWTASTSRTAQGLTVTFTSGTQIVVFTAKLAGERIATSVQNLTPTSVAPRVPSGGGSSSENVDADDEEHDDEGDRGPDTHVEDDD